MKAIPRLAFLVCALVAATAPAGEDNLYVAVFNFQMTSETPAWRWVEKGLADQITTDLSQSRNIMVVARDRMQAVASRMRWTPELPDADPHRMHEIRRALKIAHVVSGVYSVEDGQIRIVAQVVNVSDGKELTRFERSGDTGDLPSLQKQIAAEVLSWFSDVPAEDILPELPVWTRSVEATRALYEGLDLFDQGRYDEAWLKFRQSQHKDPSYLEARYWVGRMYYFMDRYEHARRSLEHFVYLAPDHPRIGDAVKEYLHTLEETGTEWEDLLRLYDDFIYRYPDARIRNELALEYPISCRARLNARSWQLLGWMGDHARATRRLSATVEELVGDNEQRVFPSGWARYLLVRNALDHSRCTTTPISLPNTTDLARTSSGASALAASNSNPSRYPRNSGPDREAGRDGIAPAAW